MILCRFNCWVMFRLQLILDAGINDTIAVNYTEEGYFKF